MRVQERASRIGWRNQCSDCSNDGTKDNQQKAKRHCHILDHFCSSSALRKTVTEMKFCKISSFAPPTHSLLYFALLTPVLWGLLVSIIHHWQSLRLAAVPSICRLRVSHPAIGSTVPRSADQRSHISEGTQDTGDEVGWVDCMGSRLHEAKLATICRLQVAVLLRAERIVEEG